MVSLQKNDESTYFQEEGRFSYHEDTQYLTSSIDESSFRGEFNLSYKENELPMFSFPATKAYPLINQEDRDRSIFQESSAEKPETSGKNAEAKTFNPSSYSEAASYSIDEEETKAASNEVDSINAPIEKVF